MIVVMAFIIYLYYCYCLWVLAHKRALTWAWTAWVPILNLLLICRLAGWGTFWSIVFTVLLVTPAVLYVHYRLKSSGIAYFMEFALPFVMLLVGLLVAIKLAVHLGRGWWFGILLVIPVVDYFALWLLAFSVPRKKRFVTVEPRAA